MAADASQWFDATSPSEQLLIGRRALEGIAGVVLLEDWKWYEQADRWVLKSRLFPRVDPSGLIPVSSDWYVLVEARYPRGSIVFYPSQDRGIVQTFPHQNCNAKAYPDRPWRKGRLCLDTSVHALGRQDYDIEPFEPSQRLRWHFLRALEWLSSASLGTLVLPGCPYELPYFPTSRMDVLGFIETPGSYQLWQLACKRHGLVRFRSVGDADRVLFAGIFVDMDGQTVVEPQTGLALSGIANTHKQGAWILLDSVPILEPWQAPVTWGELRAVCRRQGISIDDRLRSIARRLRDGFEHVLLLGAPIPDKVGESPRQIHWLPLALPVFTTREVKGFRSNEEGLWRWDRSSLLADHEELKWLHSENWSSQELSGRGSLSDDAKQKSVAVLGAGALGSALAEQLVRGGVGRMVIFDGDHLAAGNLVRHTLGLESLNCNKALALARRLNASSPQATILGVQQDFPPSDEKSTAILLGSDLVIDCTANDDVLYELGAFKWGRPRIFISVSLGMCARRLYLFLAVANTFPHTSYSEQMRPWLESEMSEYDGLALPREGIGCWHPVFPARVDDVWMMSSITVQIVQETVLAPPTKPGLVVFEQMFTEGKFAGIRRIS